MQIRVTIVYIELSIKHALYIMHELYIGIYYSTNVTATVTQPAHYVSIYRPNIFAHMS